MSRLLVLIVALAACVAAPAFAAPKLERVILVMRHGVRPPTSPNADLAKYADQPWPDWEVAPGELTPHGGETVKLMGGTLARAYRAAGLLPAHGCAQPGEVAVWSDNATTRTEATGQILADALQPGCGLKTGYSLEKSRDPMFDGLPTGACKIDDAVARVSGLTPPSPEATAATTEATQRLQRIFAPKACSGGAGACFTAGATLGGAFPAGSSLSEDLLLEYTNDKPMKDVGWGRASAADIADVLAIHEKAFASLRDNPYTASRRGAMMARVILTALAGGPIPGEPVAPPNAKLIALSGHDTNLVLMAGVFGLRWKLPSEPDATAPSTVLAFELWSDGAKRYVVPVIYYETLDQLRTLQPADAKRLPLSFGDCTDGPNGSCPVDKLEQRVQALIPPGCGELVSAPRAVP